MTYQKQLKIFSESQEVFPAEEVRPEAGLFTEWLFDAFFQISAERTDGFNGPGSITARMCLDYCFLHGIDDQKFFYRAMKAADAIWFQHRQKVNS